jgi:predicted XRE-type DNA-binding protein
MEKIEFMPRAADLAGIIATEHDMRNIITRLIESMGSQKAVAELIGVSQTHLGDLLRGKKPFGRSVAQRLGWRKVTVFFRQ